MYCRQYSNINICIIKRSIVMTDIKTIKHLSKVVSVAKNTGIDALIVSYNMMVNTGKGGEA